MGIFFATLSAVFSSTKDLFSKHLSTIVDSTVSTLASFFYALPFYLLFFLILTSQGVDLWSFGPSFLALVVLRAATDCAAEWMKMHSMHHGDISLLACFFSIAPLFLLFLSPLITGDPMTWHGTIGIILIVVGSIILLYKPVGNFKASSLGVLYAVGFAFMSSVSSCFDRLAVQDSHPALAGFAMTALAALFMLPFTKRKSTQIFSTGRKFFIWRGLFEFLFMFSKLTALQYMQAPNVSGIMKLSVLISILGGRFVFKEGEFKKRMIGGAFMAAGIIQIIIGEI